MRRVLGLLLLGCACAAMAEKADRDKQTIELFDNARVNRGGDQVAGNYIFVDQRSDFFSVSAGKGAPGGRVKAVIQPKAAPQDAKK